MAEQTPIFISVVRDWIMYDRCVKNNPQNAGIECVTFDNTHENKAIPTHYNAFISSFDFSKSAWLVFCHEDFQLHEDIRLKLDACDKNAIYGPIGTRTRRIFPWFLGGLWKSEMCGHILQCEKSGAHLHDVGGGLSALFDAEVEMLDCQCLVVHSSLIERFKFRFDENLPFDLYVEDFCEQAHLKDVKVRILPLESQHWSSGVIGARYRQAEIYFNRKYPTLNSSAPGFYYLGGGVPRSRRLQVWLGKMLEHVMPQA